MQVRSVTRIYLGSHHDFWVQNAFPDAVYLEKRVSSYAVEGVVDALNSAALESDVVVISPRHGSMSGAGIYFADDELLSRATLRRLASQVDLRERVVVLDACGTTSVASLFLEMNAGAVCAHSQANFGIDFYSIASHLRQGTGLHRDLVWYGKTPA